MNKKAGLCLFLLIPLMLNALASSESPAAALPTDPAIKTGTLDNGLDWYVMSNDLPGERAELRLIVKAGSVLEEENQRGLAHFLEHMAFNGTEKYPENELVDYLQSLGMEFGPDINAHTSFDETVYQLTVDTANPGELDRALDVFEQWAFHINLTDEEIDKERPVILEERRIGRDATGRMTEKGFPLIFKDSLYGERLPIGLEEVIQSATAEQFQAFYDDWYRPELMSIIVVGDVDGDEAIRLIGAHFASYANKPDSPERIQIPVPDHAGPLFTIQTDPEATTASLEIINKFTPVTTDTPEAWDSYFTEQLFSAMFNARISESLREENPAFINGYASIAGYAQDKHLFQWGVMTNPGEMARGFRSFWTEVERVRRYGFTRGEVERAGAQMKAGYEYILKEKLTSSQLTSLISSAVETGDALTPLDWEYERLTGFLSAVTPGEVRAYGDKWFTDSSRVISFMGDENAPSEDQIRQLMIQVAESDIAPYEEGKSHSTLLDQKPRAGSIASREYDEEAGLHIWTLSNGARVVLKPTDFKQNEILFKALSPGGVSLVPQADLISAALAPTAVNQSGLGMMTTTELSQFMTGKSVSLSPSIGDYWESLNGYAVPADLEYLFQLVYLYFNAPLYRPSGWNAYETRLAAYLGEQERDPLEQYSRLLNETVYMGHPRAKMLTAETLGEMDYDEAYALFRQRFFDGDDFTFYFTGAMDLEQMEEFARVYLASLISVPESEDWRDVGLRFNKSATERTLEAGMGDQGRVTLIYAGDMAGDKSWSYEESYYLSVLAEGLQNRLLETVREDFGGVYNISVSARAHRIPVEEYAFSISFSCDPDKTKEIIDLIEEETENFANATDLSVYASDARESRLRGYEENLQNNSWYLANISFLLSRDLDLSLLYGGEELARGITAEKMRDFAIKYLHNESRQTVILIPENQNGD